MRRRYTAVLITLFAVGCADSPTTTTASIQRFDAMMKRSLSDFIQDAIDRYLPKGFESAVEARWASIQQKKNSGDFAGAVSQLNTLSLWIDKKTADITIPTGETATKAQAAALIVLNMSRWVYEGADADPHAVPTGDVAIEVVPAGAPLALVVPSLHASVVWGAGATQEDRIVVMMEDPGTYPAQCQGPLPTRRCQYPLFYTVESFPHVRLQTPGKLAVCLVTTGDRRPIEYLEDESAGEHGPVGERLRLAHNAPENEADYTPNSIVEDGVEILPLSSTQSNLAQCNEPSTIGMGPLEKTLYLAMRFVGKVVSPKEAWAFDQGPEHDFALFSNFNAVDPLSGADLAVTNAIYTPGAASVETRSLSYQITNTSRRSGGGATGAALGVMARAYISQDATLDETDQLLGSSSLGTMVPDGTPQPISHTGFDLPFEGPVYLIVNVVQTGGLDEVTLENNTVVVDLNPPVQDGDGSNQSNTVNTGTSYSCSGSSLFQSFTPTLFGLTGVDLLLRQGGSMPENGYSSVINIRAGSPAGTVIGTATATVPFTATSQQTWVQYTFSNLLETSAETVYFIEWVSPAPSIVTWMGSSTDTYSRGTAYGCGGESAAPYDYNFKTFAPAPIG